MNIFHFRLWTRAVGEHSLSRRRPVWASLLILPPSKIEKLSQRFLRDSYKFPVTKSLPLLAKPALKSFQSETILADQQTHRQEAQERELLGTQDLPRGEMDIDILSLKTDIYQPFDKTVGAGLIVSHTTVVSPIINDS
jgi:hypothetical protein